MKNRLLEQLKKSENVLILTHMSPDGDALGSAVSLKCLLTGMGINANCVIDDIIPLQYEFLKNEFIVAKKAPENYDFIIFVDCASKDRCTVEYKNNIITCVIDHHISNLMDCDINIVENTAATTEIIYSLFKEYNIPLTNKAAEAIFTGIITDTGAFSFSNTTADTHLITASLYDYDFDRSYIARKTMQEKTLTYSKIYSYLFDNIIMMNDNIIAIGYLPNDAYISLKATSSDTEGLSQVIRSISGVECGIFLTEQEKGVIKGSVRTNEAYDANNIASMFGGGGHIRAAGFRTSLTISEIKEKINEWISINQ